MKRTVTIARLWPRLLVGLFLLLPISAWSRISVYPDSVLKVDRDSIFSIKPGAVENSMFVEAPDILEEGMFVPPTANNDSIQRYIDLARTVIDKVRATQNFITNIDEASKVELPVGISKTIGGLSYDIAIQAIRLKPQYAELDVFMQFEVPQNGTILTFMARGIKFSKSRGIVGDAKLELLGDYGINFNGDKVQLILKGTSGEGTYVTMDCDGFKEMALDADIKFSRDLLLPDNTDGSAGPGNVQSNFKIKLSNWNDLIVQLSLPNFQVKGLNGVGFSVQDAVFDFSDLRNAPAVVFPEGYQSAQLLPDNVNLWRGFYLRSLTVRMPPEFQKKGSSARTSFAAENVLIDNQGVSGKFIGKNIISLSEGNMNGWAFSLDSVGLELMANQLVQAGFDGGLVIPIGKEDKPFEYSAVINTGGNYLFSVSPTDEMTFPLWGAGKVDIYESSYLEIKIQDGKFLPKASLTGKMSIAAKLSDGGQGVSLADIAFERLEIQSVKPYIKVGAFSFGSEALQQKMGGFPISISDIGMKSISDTELGLDFKLKLNLVGESAGSFAADAGLTLIGNLDAGQGLQHWKYKTIQVNEIGVDIDGGAFKINGRLIFYRNDNVYGDGFNGTVKAEFTPGLKVTATAIFGNVKEMRYWYADALINFPVGIPIFAGVGIYGFGGGAYYSMKMDNQGLGSDLGRTASGVVYVPDEKSGLGLKAIVSIGSYPKPEAFNADVTFEISFFKTGGVRYIAFGGNGYLVTPGLDVNLDKMKGMTNKMVGQVKKLASTVSDATMGFVKADEGGNSATAIFGEVGDKAGQKGQISAKVMISYDFENSILHGDFEVFIKVAGGLIQGVGPNGRAGWAVLHFAPSEWYVYVGTPDDRCGVALGVGPIRASATSYFMVGSKILGSPPPPPEVTRILGGGDYDYMKDLNEIGTGGGFAFGAALSVDTGDLQFLMFYAHFAAGLGFDIMLKDYGDLHCKGSDKAIGINGWYANGQAYAYFEGSVGIRVKVFGRKRDVKILSIGAAVLLQAALPNPIWLQGTVGGYFSVLGGLVKGNCKFQVTLGEKCEMQGDPNAILNDIKVIAQLTPSNGEKEVNVFNTPQVLFNMAVDKQFDLMDEGDVKRTFRIKLDYAKLVADKQEVPVALQWNDNHDVLALNSFDILPSKKDVVFSVQTGFEELKNGVWAAVVTDGQRVTEKLEQSFATGVAPDYIPQENIAYSYPVIGQLNYYKDETSEGYIQLKKGQPDLFNLGAEWKQRGRVTPGDGAPSYFDFRYESGTRAVSFSMPGDVKTNQLYMWELVNLPAQKAAAIDKNVTNTSNNVQTDTGESLDLEVGSKQAEGSRDELQEKSIFTAFFKSSSYASFAAKLNSVSFTKGYSWMIANGIDELKIRFSGNELFDHFETGGSEGFASLIQGEAVGDERWYQNKVKPLVYDDYPIAGALTLKKRTPEVLGIPPFKAVHFDFQNDYVVPQENARDGVAAITYARAPVLIYDLAEEMSMDYLDILVQAANSSLSSDNPRVNYLLTTPFPVLMFDYYKVKLRYVLPGTQKVTSEKEITIDYKY